MVDLDELKLQDPRLRERIDTLLDAPAELLLPERLLLYALVRGLRPERCLEIGTHFGGSTTVICAALDDVGRGRVICVDPNPLVPPAVWARLSHRASIVRSCSPDALVEAYTLAGGDFEFAFIDGDHTHDGVVRDVKGVLEVVAPGAHLLFHDSHYWEVGNAIDDCLRRWPAQLVDAGTLSTVSTDPIPAPDGTVSRWGGFRMLRVPPRPSHEERS